MSPREYKDTSLTKSGILLDFNLSVELLLCESF